MTKVGIIIPVRNCLHYTVASIESIKTKHPYEIFVVDDRSTDGTKQWLQAQSLRPGFYSVSDPAESTGLAYNWNLGCKMALESGCTHLLVANNDVLYHPETIDALVDRIDRGDVVMATGVNVQGLCPSPTDIFTLERGEDTEAEHPDFSMFMITAETIEKIGRFDENFKGAYCEDCDFHARVILLGERAICVNLAPYYHYASATVRENPHLSGEISSRHHENKDYFRRKWGCEIVSEPAQMRAMYNSHPYADPAYSPKQWA